MQEGTSKNQFRQLFEVPYGALSIGVGGYKSTTYVTADHVLFPQTPIPLRFFEVPLRYR